MFRVASSAVLLAGGGVIHLRSAATSSPTPPRLLLLYYGALTASFMASLGIAGLLRAGRGRRSPVLGDLQIIMDTCVTSVLVYATGGQDSVLTFLFPLNTLYAAALVSAPAGYAVAVTGAAAFAGLVALQVTGVVARVEEVALLDRDAVSVVTATAGANMLVALLAGQLTEQLRRSGDTLQQTRVDLGALRRLHTAMVSSVASGLVSTDPDGRVALMNPAAERILGLSAGEAAGRAFQNILGGAPSDWDGAWEERYQRPDGVVRHLAVTSARLQDDAGVRIGSVMTLMDVTEQRQLEAAILHSRQLATVGQFAAGLAHELRNPLGSMLGCVELLEASTPRDGDDARLLGIVHREADRLAHLVGDFLAYARPAEPQVSRLDVSLLLSEMAFELAKDGTLRVRVETRCPEGLFLRADSGQVRQVLWNLLRNAAEASPPDALVVVSANRSSMGGRPGITLSVRDHGAGLPAGARERLFEPFFTTKAKGTGLGLAIVHRIVQQHGGLVTLQEPEGPGTCFSVTLPEDDGTLPPVSPEAPPSEDGQRLGA